MSLFPTLLGTYGDGGNAVVLAQRCRWRGIAAEVVAVDVGDVVPETGDVYVMGGGEDGAQMAAAEALGVDRLNGTPLSRALSAGAQLLAVCAGLQLIGDSFTAASGAVTPGLGLLDLTTRRLPKRAVGELLAKADPSLGLPPLSGFENHGGHTLLGPTVQPLARVVRGVGNGPPLDGDTRGEGALSDHIVATYLHGPVLARNPHLADLLLARALGRRLQDLPELDVPEHDALRRALGAAHP